MTLRNNSAGVQKVSLRSSPIKPNLISKLMLAMLFISLQILAKLQAYIDAGHYYEAQQMFKTVYHRHRARKMLNESYSLVEVCSHIVSSSFTTATPFSHKPHTPPYYPYTLQNPTGRSKATI